MYGTRNSNAHVAQKNKRSDNLKILYVAPCWPYGESYGSTIRAFHLTHALKQVGEVHLAVVDYAVPSQETIDRTASEFRLLCHGQFKQVPELSFIRRKLRALNPRVLTPNDWVVEERVARHVMESLHGYDLVWLFQQRTAYAFECWRWPHSVLYVDDIASTYERSILQNGKTLRERLRAGCQMLVWKRREKLFHERFDVVAVCSNADREYLDGESSIHVIPNGFDRPAREPERSCATPPRIGFIGRFVYPPNLDGMRWFVRECWPRIKEKVPGARLRLVGSGTEGPLKPEGPDIDGLGWKADPSEEIATWSLMIVPIQTGAGTRVKIAEAFSRKCPVVSTHLGAFGYEVVHGRELLLSGSSNGFADSCLQLLHQPCEAVAMAERAWQRFLTEWTWDAITPRIWATAEDCLRRSRRKAQ